MSGALPRWSTRVLVVAVASVGIGCATVMNGTMQDIGITSLPRGAAVTIDDESRGQTPLVAAVSRRSSHVVKVELAGYHPVEGTLTRHTNGWVWGNIALGGLIGLSVDLLAGGMYDLHPRQIDALLQPLPSPSAPASAEGLPPAEGRPEVSPPVSASVPPPPVDEAVLPPSVRSAPPLQPVYASAALQPGGAAPQCDDPVVRAQCPLYQYRLGIYRARCQDGSGVEVRAASLTILPPQMGPRDRPWQAEGCAVATDAPHSRP